jgi:membrane protease YdiL (CAAX protease family)
MKHLYKKAIMSGALISIVPAIIVSLLSSWFPATESENLALIRDIFSAQSYGFLQYFLIFSIIVVSPIIEEVIFRGVLWSFLKRYVNEKSVFIATSLIFAAVHIDFLHVVGLLPASFLFGWFRYKTGDIKASLLCHMSNNLVACLLTIY